MRETILVVEDGEAVRNLVCRMLVHSGYQVLEACDGRDALHLCKAYAEPIHLVLTDLVMPNMNGGELAFRLQCLRPDLRVLFMSGYAEQPVVQKLGRESTILLHKPFSSVTLADKVRQILDSPWEGFQIGWEPGG